MYSNKGEDVMIYNIEGIGEVDLNYVEGIFEVEVWDIGDDDHYWFDIRISGGTYSSPKYSCECMAQQARQKLMEAWIKTKKGGNQK